MAKAHEGSKSTFTPKTMLPTDKNTTMLLHFDTDKGDPVNGVYPIGNDYVFDFSNNGAQMGLKLDANTFLSSWFTVSGWVYVRSATQWSRWFDFHSNQIRGYDGAGGLFSFKGNYSGPALVLRNGSNVIVHDHEIDVPFPLNQWVYLTVTYDANTRISQIYYNGILQSTYTGSAAFQAVYTQDNWIGRSHWDGDAPTDAKFDGFAIWDHVRTPTQIRRDMWVRTLTGDYTVDPRLNIYYPLSPNSLEQLYVNNKVAPNMSRDTNFSNYGFQASMYSAAGYNWGAGYFHRGVTELVPGTYVDCGPSITRQAEGTIEFWMRPQTLADYWNVFSTGPGNAAIRFELSGNSNPFSVAVGNDSGTYTSVVVVPKGQYLPAYNTWCHVALTWDAGNNVKVYVNGELKVTQYCPYMPTNLSQMRIGTGFDYSANRSITGQMADVRLWTIVRTQQEIKDCMGHELSGKEVGLLRNWKLNETSGATCVDARGLQNGTIVGSYAYVRRVDKAPYPNVSRGLLNAQIRRDVATNWYVFSNSGTGNTLGTVTRNRNKFGPGISVGVKTTNLVSGGDCEFELPTMNNGLYVNQCQTVNLQSNYVYSGRKALKIRGGIANWGGAYRLGTWSVMNGMTVGTTYTFSAMVMVPRIDANIYYQPSDFGLSIYTNWQTQVCGVTRFDEWQRVSITWTVPAGTTYIMPSINFPGDATTGTWTEMYVDEVQLEAKPFATTFDSSTGGRMAGQLWYPNPLLGCSQGTLSIWARAEAMASSTSANWAFPVISTVRKDDTGHVQFLFFGPTTENIWFLWTKSVGQGAASTKWTGAITNPYDWHHYAITFSGNVLKFYIDGTLVYTQSDFDYAEFRKAGVIFLGSEGLAGPDTRQFVGVLDEFRADGVARTDDEILAFYNASAPFYPK